MSIKKEHPLEMKHHIWSLSPFSEIKQVYIAPFISLLIYVNAVSFRGTAVVRSLKTNRLTL